MSKKEEDEQIRKEALAAVCRPSPREDDCPCFHLYITCRSSIACTFSLI
jgi:hypothetical protein